MKHLFKFIATWIVAPLPGAMTIIMLRNSHGWGVSILAALGIYFIIGILELLAEAYKMTRTTKP